MKDGGLRRQFVLLIGCLLLLVLMITKERPPGPGPVSGTGADPVPSKKPAPGPDPPPSFNRGACPSSSACHREWRCACKFHVYVKQFPNLESNDLLHSRDSEINSVSIVTALPAFYPWTTRISRSLNSVYCERNLQDALGKAALETSKKSGGGGGGTLHRNSAHRNLKSFKSLEIIVGILVCDDIRVSHREKFPFSDYDDDVFKEIGEFQPRNSETLFPGGMDARLSCV